MGFGPGLQTFLVGAALQYVSSCIGALDVQRQRIRTKRWLGSPCRGESTMTDDGGSHISGPSPQVSHMLCRRERYIEIFADETPKSQSSLPRLLAGSRLGGQGRLRRGLGADEGIVKVSNVGRLLAVEDELGYVLEAEGLRVDLTDRRR